MYNTYDVLEGVVLLDETTHMALDGFVVLEDNCGAFGCLIDMGFASLWSLGSLWLCRVFRGEEFLKTPSPGASESSPPLPELLDVTF